jgi:UDP-N-acetylglucosamine 2-epimerase (non-hydrolysing)
MKKISIILGTRPEAIKLCPIIKELQRRNNVICNVCVTAQHRQMLDQVLEVFEVIPDVDLNLMKQNQTLAEFTSRALSNIDEYLKIEKPDIVVAQGDTTTVFCSSLAAFYNKIDFAHVEAGLRTGSLMEPWPEELNRVLTSKMTRWHFAPTNIAKDNLLHENVGNNNIFVSGNTVIDALLYAVKYLETKSCVIDGISPEILNCFDTSKMILITGHRRENLGDGLVSICNAILKLAYKYPDVYFVYPVHMNPNVKNIVFEILGKKHLSNICLIPPQKYLSFVSLMMKSYLILTDSGGVQEEAPSLGKPVLVMRNKTERPEAVESGVSKLVGTSEEQIIDSVSQLIDHPEVYKKMQLDFNPYGNGDASQIICDVLLSKENIK